jgi:predicted Rossmann fold flavoprotein
VAASRIAIIGGGAAGFFAAIAAARAKPDADVRVLERGTEFLSKVRISGGGRCNVTHGCFEPRKLAAAYPRGSRELLGPFHRFQPADTLDWFGAEGVELKTEADGRVFPVSDSSVTIVECLLAAADRAGVRRTLGAGVESARRDPGGGFELVLHNRESLSCDTLMIATGGSRTRSGARIAEALGHALEPPVPSLFTFHVEIPWLRELSGITVESVHVSISGTARQECGPLLVTHWGLSGPVVLKLSAYAAREIAERGYRFELRVAWLPGRELEPLADELLARREREPNRLVANGAIAPLPSRLWKALVHFAGIAPDTRFGNLSRSSARALASVLTATVLPVAGKSLNKDEFVTCGGVRLKDIDFRTMESKLSPGLYFGGEVLDIDGITGGFNFQAAWTTGWIAGHAMAGVEPQRSARTVTAG